MDDFQGVYTDISYHVQMMGGGEAEKNYFRHLKAFLKDDSHYRERILFGTDGWLVRMRLTEGRGPGAVLLDNHGILTFQASGRLADYHGPLPADASEGEVLALFHEARQLGLDRHGAPLAIVREPDGHLTVEARVMRGSGINDHVEAFTLDNPEGERREILAVVRGGDGR